MKSAEITSDGGKKEGDVLGTSKIIRILMEFMKRRLLFSKLTLIFFLLMIHKFRKLSSQECQINPEFFLQPSDIYSFGLQSIFLAVFQIHP